MGRNTINQNIKNKETHFGGGKRIEWIEVVKLFLGHVKFVVPAGHSGEYASQLLNM